MSRKKCMQCKEWITDNIVETIIGDKPMHFCSEKCKDIADKEHKEKEKKAADKDRAYRLVCDILGVPEVINTALWREWSIWNRVKSDEIIAQYLSENKEELTKLIARLSSGEYAKIRYISAILKNNLGDYKPRVEEKERPHVVNIDEGYETKYKRKFSRKSFEDLEEDI